MRLLQNVHEAFPPPDSTGETFLVQGNYDYWHYGCDGFNDKGWGCGYRTLQTICSWIINNKPSNELVPSIKTIQEILVILEDKEKSFFASRDWIGSFEVCLVLDHIYDVPSKIIHIPRGTDLKNHIDSIKNHFKDFGCPIMMGGDKDCSSKGIVGIHSSSTDTHLLIIDPHYTGNTQNTKQLQNDHWVKWQNLDDFVDSSFYNLCLPQVRYSPICK